MARIHPLLGALSLIATLTAAGEARAQCTSNADCRAGRVCNKSGACVALACSKDIDCPDNGTCEAGTCKTAAQSTPALAPAEPKYRVETTSMPALWATGLAIFGSAWIATIAVTAGVSDDNVKGRATGFVSIPVAGPWVLLGSNIDTHSYTAPLVLSGILQGAGLALTITGFAIRRERRVPVVSLGAGPDAPTIAFVPAAGGGALVGTF
jgi:hypothetical protein